jgi:hypothetical protein
MLSIEIQDLLVQWLGDSSSSKPMVCGFRCDAVVVDEQVKVLLQGNNPQQCLDLRIRREPSISGGGQVALAEEAERVAVAVANALAAHLQPLSATGQTLCRPSRRGAECP